MKAFDISNKMEDVKLEYSKALHKAERYYKDIEKLDVISDEAFAKAHRVKKSIQNVWEYLELFTLLIKDHLSGTYRSTPKAELIKIIAAMLYFVSTVDVFPDFIPLFGFIDDAFVIGLVAASAEQAIGEYRRAMRSKSTL